MRAPGQMLLGRVQGSGRASCSFRPVWSPLIDKRRVLVRLLPTPLNFYQDKLVQVFNRKVQKMYK